MPASPKTIRRVSGSLFLGAAALMVILGVTVLEPRLAGRAFAWYWLVCFICLWMSLMAAWLDLRAIRNEAREAQSRLIREVFSNESEDGFQPGADSAATEKQPPAGDKE